MRTQASKLKVALGVLAAPNLLTGLWALFVPRSWYEDFPGQGLGWVATFGAYNEHFVQDIGGAYLAFGVLTAYTAVRPTASLVRGAMLGYLVFAVPHFLIHVFVRASLDATGYLGTLTPLAFSVGLAAWIAASAASFDPEPVPVPVD